MISKLLSWLQHLFRNPLVRGAVLLGSCLVLLAIAFSSYQHAKQGDLKTLYLGGLAWIKGLNAYDPDVLNRLETDPLFAKNNRTSFFAYPPTIGPFVILSALLPFAKTKALKIVLDIFCVGVLAFFSVRLIERPEVKALSVSDSWHRWLVPALIIAHPFTSSVISHGQTTLVIAAALISGWYYARRERWVIAGALLAIAAIKPQVTILIFLWLLLERRWRLLAFTGIASLILCLFTQLVSGSPNLIVDWFGGLESYLTVKENSLGHYVVFNIQNLLYLLGIELPSLFPIAILLTILLWLNRSHLLIDDIAALLLCLSLLLGFSHYPDLAILPPFLLAAFWKHVFGRINAVMVAFTLLFLMSFPRVFLLRLFEPNELLLQWRVVVLLILAIWLAVMSFQRASKMRSFAAYDLNSLT